MEYLQEQFASEKIKAFTWTGDLSSHTNTRISWAINKNPCAENDGKKFENWPEVHKTNIRLRVNRVNYDWMNMMEESWEISILCLLFSYTLVTVLLSR